MEQGLTIDESVRGRKGNTAMRSDNLGQRLLELKEKLETQKEQRSQLQGELRSLMKQLKDEFDVDTLEGAEALLEEQTEALNELEQELETKIKELEEEMGK
jgi:predicted transcriptional regulator